jgi:hypothetical protein
VRTHGFEWLRTGAGGCGAGGIYGGIIVIGDAAKTNYGTTGISACIINQKRDETNKVML